MNMRSSAASTGGAATLGVKVSPDGPAEAAPARIVAPTPPAVRRQGESGPAQPTPTDDHVAPERSRFFATEASEEHAVDEATHGSGRRNAEIAGSDDHALPRGRNKPMGQG